jgi:hypothetical protein
VAIADGRRARRAVNFGLPTMCSMVITLAQHQARSPSAVPLKLRLSWYLKADGARRSVEPAPRQTHVRPTQRGSPEGGQIRSLLLVDPNLIPFRSPPPDSSTEPVLSSGHVITPCSPGALGR